MLPRRRPITDIVYISCSSYSGSTLLSFLLNAHSAICSAGHTTGWRFREGKGFPCSCGQRIQDCPFYNKIASAFRRDGLAFEYHSFGTDLRLVNNDRLNRYLTVRMPRFLPSGLESTRDRLVRLLPGAGEEVRRVRHANRTFVDTALSHFGARVYVDNSHRPFRLRMLKDIDGFDVRALHLVRDFRGVAFSNMKLRGVGAAHATGAWLGEQADITRVSAGLVPTRTVFYEDICDATDDTLADIHRFVGVAPETFGGDFKSSEHHILGNVMRFGPPRIAKSTTWRDELPCDQRDVIERTAQRFVRRQPRHPVSDIVRRYLD